MEDLVGVIIMIPSTILTDTTDLIGIDHIMDTVDFIPLITVVITMDIIVVITMVQMRIILTMAGMSHEVTV